MVYPPICTVPCGVLGVMESHKVMKICKCMSRICLYIILMAFSLVTCALADGMTQDFHLAGEIYRIPAKYLLPDLPHTLVPQGDAMDISEGLTLKIPLHDLKISATFSNAGAFSDNILIFISDKGVYSNKLNISSDAFEALSGTGAYRERIVETDKGTGFYRVYAKSRHPYIWHYFDSTTGKLNPDARWVADCTLQPGTVEAEDLSNVICHSQVLFERAQAKITFSAGHVSRIQSIRSGIELMVQKWAQ